MLSKKAIVGVLKFTFGKDFVVSESLIVWYRYQTLHRGSDMANWPWWERNLSIAQRVAGGKYSGFEGEMIEGIQKGMDISPALARAAVREIKNIIMEGVDADGRVAVRGFGTWSLQLQDANIVKGSHALAPVLRHPVKIKFKPHDALKAALN